MPGHAHQDHHRIAAGIAAPVAQCRIKGLPVPLRIVAGTAVHVEQILDIMNRLELLPVALLFVLRVLQILRVGHPPAQFFLQQGVIGRLLGQNLEAGAFHRVESYVLAGRKTPQELHGLSTGIGEIAEPQVASVQQEDGGAALRLFRRGIRVAGAAIGEGGLARRGNWLIR